MKKSLILCAVTVLFGCSDNSLDAPKKFFNSHKAGTSADYGLMKWGDDHVATFHGFADDLDACLKTAAMFNHDACKETGGSGCLNPFSCKALNH